MRRRFTKYPNSYVKASNNTPNRKDIKTDIWNSVCEAVENPDFYLSGFDNFSLKNFFEDSSDSYVSDILICIDRLSEAVATYIEMRLDEES